MTPAQILLIDDHPLFRSGITMVLAAGLKDVDVLGTGSLDEALRLADYKPALVLLDVQLQGVSGLEGIASLKRKWPTADIVIVSALDLSDVVSEALARGARAYISKTERPERLLQLIEHVLDNGQAGRTALAPLTTHDARPKLTPRQNEVLDLLCQGLSNKMIGRRMNLSEHTVRGHVQALLAALEVSSRSEAAFAARRLGLIR
jgi:DNA-binding NarL/FixJ family response regulator